MNNEKKTKNSHKVTPKKLNDIPQYILITFFHFQK